MTMPVGAGKNACFGFEDDNEMQSKEGPLSPLESKATEPLTSDASAKPDVAPSPKAAAEPPKGCAIAPDYYSLSGSAGFGVTASVSATIDRYGHTYTAGGGGLGSGVGFALHAGYLRDPDHPCAAPDAETLRNFLTGPATAGAVGGGLSVGLTHASGMTGRELGISTPQAGANYTLGAEHEWSTP